MQNIYKYPTKLHISKVRYILLAIPDLQNHAEIDEDHNPTN